MTNSQIVFQNIESPDLRRLIEDLMDDITQLSPSDAAVRATFRFTHGRFWADVRIASESAYMSTCDHAGALVDLLEGVKWKLMQQIVSWRNHRFAV